MKLSKAISELKRDPEFARAYAERAPRFELARAIIRRRLELGLTQAQLAAQAGTKQANISRLENAASNPSFSLLQRVARALDTQLLVDFKRTPGDDAIVTAEGEPTDTQDYSGQLVLHVPRSLHRDLVHAAEREGVDLDQYLNVALARVSQHPLAAGDREGSPGPHGREAATRQSSQLPGLAGGVALESERILADYVEGCLQQFKAATQLRTHQDARWVAENLLGILRPEAEKTPLLGALNRCVQMLRDQFELIAKLEQATIDNVLSRVSESAQADGRELSVYVIRNSGAQYTRAVTKRPRSEDSERALTMSVSTPHLPW